jgi:cell division protein FtsI (penicillin-binding protein 3)
MLVIAVVLSLFAGRLVQMQGLDWARYRSLAQDERTHTVPIVTVRGSITTSDGRMLALTVRTYVVTADPPSIKKTLRPVVAAQLAGPLKMSPATLLYRLNHSPSRDYALLKESVSATTGNTISDLKLPGTGQKLPGITLRPTYSRSYPNGTLAASLLGFTNLSSQGDLTGEAGLESQYNSLLSGRDGSEVVETGEDGVPIPLTEAKEKPSVPARNLRLTIQSNIQYEAERECKARVRQARARNCSIVVIQPSTGDILAMAQYPTFNPNAPITSLARTRNIAEENVFAPGSTLKPITVAAALEKGGQTPLNVYTVPDRISIGGFSFHDAEVHPTEHYTIAGILAYSSNDGMVQVVRHITPLQQYDYLRAFGLGSVSHLGNPAESAGLVHKPGTADYWGDEPYELSFGQGIGVTAIQMASVYATIANGGVRVQPSLVAGTTSSSGKFSPARPAPRRRVIQASTARSLMTILQQVPKVDALQGEPWGVIAGYPVASKTGTAQVSVGGNCLCQYGSSYIGIAPARNPQLVVAVNVQDPKAQGYYGDEIAGPVFYNVMKFALQTLKIPPTKAKPARIRLTMP